MKPIESSEIIEFLGDRVEAVRQTEATIVDHGCAVSPGAARGISFLSALELSESNESVSTLSSVVLVRPEVIDEFPQAQHCVLVAVSDPRREYARVVGEFFVEAPSPFVHPTAVVDEAAVLDDSCHIAAGVVLEAGVEVGPRTWLGPNVVLLRDTKIGQDCKVGPGTVIGNDGFGYSREDDGTPILVPHTGKVVLGDRVEIGSNTSIDRGTIGDTVIEDDVKIDNLVHIAHNCHIESGAFVIAAAMVAGSVKVGPRAWIAPNASIRQKLNVGADAVVGLSAVVVKDVEPGATVLGNPARELGA